MLSAEEKQSQITRVVGEILQQRRQGHNVNLRILTRRYPELMPELAISVAALQARDQPRAAGSENDAKLSFIREELPEMDAVECVDRGAQGAVYKAIHRPTRREVAIKILLGGSAATEQERRRFAREVELVARLRHPNIVRIYDSGEARGCSYIVMEFIQGLRIDDYVCVEQQSVKQIVSLICRVCDAVSAAHQHGVLHRDLKPSNILIDSEGQPRVLDFGLAKDMDAPKGPSMLSLSGQIVGTIPYLSPERVKSNDASTASDTYALGIILYELVTGTYPYPITSDNFETLSNIVHREPASPRKVITEHSSTTIKPTEINGDLERIMLKALAKEPQRRYGSVAEFATDLRHYLSGEAVAARSESKIYVLRKTVRKFRTLVIAGVVCVAILVAALIGVTAAWRRSERVAKIAMAGMEMSGLTRLGGVERDAGRRDKAEENYKKVIELAATIQSDDPLILQQLGRAHQSMASIQSDNKNLDVSAFHAKKAFDLAQKLVQREPENLIYQKQFAFALTIRGDLAFERERYDLALENYQQAASVMKSILAASPDDPNLAGDLASFLCSMGRSARKLGQFDLAAQSYTQSYEMYQRLADADPKSLSRRLDFISSESKMAILHFSYKTPEHNMEAKGWLDKADAHLSEVKQRDDASQQLESIDKLRYEITENRSLFERRLAAQNSTPTP